MLHWNKSLQSSQHKKYGTMKNVSQILKLIVLQCVAKTQSLFAFFLAIAWTFEVKFYTLGYINTLHPQHDNKISITE